MAANSTTEDCTGWGASGARWRHGSPFSVRSGVSGVVRTCPIQSQRRARDRPGRQRIEGSPCLAPCEDAVAISDGPRHHCRLCLARLSLDQRSDPLLLQSFLEDKNEEASNELSSFESALLGRDEVSSTTSCLPPRCELSESMGYSCSGTDKPVALAVSATTSSDVSASSSPQLLVSSSTVPPAAPPPATGASNGLPGASPHSTRSSPASSRPHSASPLPAPVPVSVSWSTTGPSAVPSRSQSLPSSSASTPATTKATATVAPLPVAPQQAPASRPGVAQVVSASPSPRTSGAPRLIQPKQPQILPKLSSGSANMTTPSAAATTRSQSPRAAQHKATPQPAPVPAPQPATTVQRGAAMGLNTGSPLLIGNPAAAQPGMFPAGPAQGTFLLNQYIPGLGHSPILIQGALGQIQSSLGQIQGVQLALRPPHATGLTLGPQTGPKPHGGHPGPPGTPTLVIPQNLGPRPNIFLAPPRMMSPPSFAIVPGQPLTLQQLQQLQAMLPTQTMLAQPTLGAFQTDQHQSLVQIPTFTQPQILAHDHHHHHHHHHHGALSGPLISTGGSIVSSAPSANIVTHHPVMTTTTVLHPAPPQHIPASVSAPMTSATIQQQPQAPTTTAPPAVEKPVKAPTVNLAELLKEHGIMPESTPPPSPTSSQENTISVEVPVAPAPVTESVQVVVSKSPQTVAVSPQQRVQLSLAHDWQCRTAPSRQQPIHHACTGTLPRTGGHNGHSHVDERARRYCSLADPLGPPGASLCSAARQRAGPGLPDCAARLGQRTDHGGNAVARRALGRDAFHDGRHPAPSPAHSAHCQQRAGADTAARAAAVFCDSARHGGGQHAVPRCEQCAH
ncbi:hypothetical protein HPB51_008092 [Rhipicephalus microplus]|uniref:Uncharacterized protein n=1 Tax=Rhipicephalus microplus TaxID=6941 RepID=A0A9J6ENL7_RHIMP|nr:hypothetical protein HPB51_008092 [Rhipicephalus microplus]